MPQSPALRPAAPLPPRPPESNRDAALREVSRELEATFLAEMLRSAGLGRTPESFGGGAGEDQFTSFMIREQADAMVRAGGIGLAESIFRSLKETSDVQD